MTKKDQVSCHELFSAYQNKGFFNRERQYLKTIIVFNLLSLAQDKVPTPWESLLYPIDDDFAACRVIKGNVGGAFERVEPLKGKKEE